MKILLYSSSFKPLYSPVKELPRVYCINDNCFIKVQHKSTCYLKDCEMDAPFSNKVVDVCCENCDK